jgi:hypothetical protein
MWIRRSNRASVWFASSKETCSAAPATGTRLPLLGGNWRRLLRQPGRGRSAAVDSCGVDKDTTDKIRIGATLRFRIPHEQRVGFAVEASPEGCGTRLRAADGCVARAVAAIQTRYSEARRQRLRLADTVSTCPTCIQRCVDQRAPSRRVEERGPGIQRGRPRHGPHVELVISKRHAADQPVATNRSACAACRTA